MESNGNHSFDQIVRALADAIEQLIVEEQERHD